MRNIQKEIAALYKHYTMEKVTRIRPSHINSKGRQYVYGEINIRSKDMRYALGKKVKVTIEW